MSDKYVIAVGSACIDKNYNADRWPALGDKCLIRPTGDLVGGMIANAACVLAGYGLKTCMFDALNSRQAGFILKDLQSYGLDVAHVRIDDSLADAKCIIVRTPMDRAILVVSEPRPDILLTQEEERFFAGASWIYSTPSEMRKIVGICKKMRGWRAGGVRVVLDVESSTCIEEDEELLRSASVIFFNEFGFASCLRGRSEEAFRSELFAAGVEIITVTLGAAGSETWTKDDHDRTSGRSVAVADTTGAGDTFNSSFVYCISRGHDIHRAAAFANMAASDSVTRVGPKSGVGPAERIWRMMEEAADTGTSARG